MHNNLFLTLSPNVKYNACLCVCYTKFHNTRIFFFYSFVRVMYRIDFNGRLTR